MVKTLLKIISVIMAVIIVLGGGVVSYLYYVGLLSFMHTVKEASGGQIRVACVGDSVTYGFGIKNRTKYNYPKVLGELLGDGYCVNNFGYSGRTACSHGDRPYTAEKLFRQSLSFEPDIVVIMLGSNDSKTDNWNSNPSTEFSYPALFESDYADIIEKYASCPSDPKIYVVLPIPAYAYKGEVKYRIQPEVIAEEIVPITRQIAEEKGLTVIDMYSVFDGRQELYSDGLHPTAEGAALFAQTVYDAITQYD